MVHEGEGALDRPLAPLLLGDQPLHTTHDVQLAMFTVGLVAWEAARRARPEPPAAFAGHSLGQITALVAAGVVGRTDGFRLAQARAEATQRAAEQNPGRLVALLGADVGQAEAACDAAPGECWIANLNAAGQVVIGGTVPGTDAAMAEARRVGVRRARPLDVAGAFHTPLMSEAVEVLRPTVEALTLRPGAAPVVANEDARIVSDVEEWRRRLLDHLVRPVRWEECVHQLGAMGARRLVEPGAATLSALVRRIDPQLEAESITAPDVAGVPGPAAQR